MLEDAGVSSILASEQHAERMFRLGQPLGAPVHVIDPLLLDSPGWACGSSSGQGANEAGAGAGADRSSSSSSNGGGSLAGGKGAVAGALDALGAWQLRQEVEARLGGVEPEDGALLIYTSGTTGSPKGGRAAVKAGAGSSHYCCGLLFGGRAERGVPRQLGRRGAGGERRHPSQPCSPLKPS